MRTEAPERVFEVLSAYLADCRESTLQGTHFNLTEETVVKANVIRGLRVAEKYLDTLCGNLFAAIKRHPEAQEEGPSKAFMIMANILYNDVKVISIEI